MNDQPNHSPLTLFGIPIIEKEFMEDGEIIIIPSLAGKLPLEITSELDEDGKTMRFVARVKKAQTNE